MDTAAHSSISRIFEIIEPLYIKNLSKTIVLWHHLKRGEKGSILAEVDAVKTNKPVW